MSVFQQYPFNDQADYNVSNVQVTGGVAKLSLTTDPGNTFTQNFASDSGFTYDNTKSEFASNLLRQKSQLFVPDFASVVGLDTSPGSLTKSSGPEIWGAAGAISLQTIAVRGYVQFTPGTTDKAYLVGLSSSNDSESFEDIEFAIYCRDDQTILVLENGVNKGTFGSYLTTDVFRVEVFGGVVTYKKNGTTFYTSLASPSLPLFMDSAFFNNGGIVNNIEMVTGYEYVENKVDLPNFVYSGLGFVTTLETLAVTEVGSPRYIIEGFYWNGSAWVASNGSYAQASSLANVNANLSSLTLSAQTAISVSVVFQDSTTLASVDTLILTYTKNIYNSLGYLEPIQALNVAALLSYDHDETTPALTEVGVILKVDGELKYHDGADWVDSDGSLSQSNSLSEMMMNISSYEFGANSTVYIRWVLSSGDEENETPELSDATVEYNFGGIEFEAETCIVYGYYKDIENNGVQNATVSASLNKKPGLYREANHNIIEKSVSTETDVNGYFSLNLIRSSEYESGSGEYIITIVLDDDTSTVKSSSGKLIFTVPDAESKDITDLFE